MKRRDFIKNTALIAAATGTSSVAQAAKLLKPDEKDSTLQPSATAEDQPLLASAPMLQNYAETSVGVAFAVSALANGFVEIGEQPDLSDKRRVMCGGYRMTDIDDNVILVRLTGLKPATTYYYRIGADRIEYKDGYHMSILGTETDSHIYHFTTAGAAARAHFCVINDTHVNWEAFGRAIDKIAELSPSCVIWNGDACNVEETVDAQKRIFLSPEIKRKDYAASLPYLFCPGNHDSRGMANRHLERVWMYRQPEERSPRDWDLGRNFAVRMGDVAIVGLDTAEDKLDTNPLFAGLFNSKAYREAQTLWLKDALSQPEIASAPFLVTICHIPLFDDDPTRNPGDIAPADKDPQYTTDYAAWQRTCARMWAPLMEQANSQLLITAHQHRYRYDAPTAERPWAQIVGGGPDIGNTEHPDRFPTVIEGKVVDGKLRVTIHNLEKHVVQEEFEFLPRKIKKSKKKKS